MKTLFVSNISWDFIWQRHQALAELFGRDGAVLFCEIPGLRRAKFADVSRLFRRLARPYVAGNPLSPGVTRCHPRLLPSAYALSHRFNRWRLRVFAQQLLDEWKVVDLLVTYSPSRAALDLIEFLQPKRLVYDCTDDWRAVEAIPKWLPNDEVRLLRAADLTFVPSRVLLQRKEPFARRICRLPHGASTERFRVGAKAAGDPVRRTLLYYGHIHRQHLDCELLCQIARLQPHWNLLLVGPIKTPYVFPTNVSLKGAQPHDQLYKSVVQADVLLMPYSENEYTRAVMPAKSYEYLATGRPIVATPLPELLEEFQSVMTFARGAAGWIAAVESALVNDSADKRSARIALAAGNTWENRYRRVRALLTELES